MRTIKILIRVLFLFTLIALFIYTPFFIDRYGRETFVPYVENVFRDPQFAITDLSVNSVSYAFPIGIRFKGVSGTILHRSADFKEQNLIFSSDSVHLRLPYSMKIFDGALPLEVLLNGGIIRSKLDLLSARDPSASLLSINDRRFIFEKLALQKECNWSIIMSYKEIDFDRLKDCILTNWQEGIDLSSSSLEVVLNDEKLGVALKRFHNFELEFSELQFNELSAHFRSPFSTEEINVIRKYPLYTLDLLAFRQFAEEESIKLFSEDIKRLEGFQYAFYHYLLATYFGESFSKILTPQDDSSQSIYETERLKFFAALGRVSQEKGIPVEDFKDPSFISGLLNYTQHD